MQWLWTNILKPVLKWVADFLWESVKWAFKNPVAAIAVGTVAVIGALFIDGDATRAYVSAWGWTMIAAGVLGWIVAGIPSSAVLRSRGWTMEQFGLAGAWGG